MKNLGYFFKEAKTIFRIDFLSNLLSIFSIGLIFFILSSIVSAWWISQDLVDMLKKEAEINIYFDEKMTDSEINNLIEGIRMIREVGQVKLVDKEESHDRMVDILGKEAKVLELFDSNPFQAFIEVKINMEKLDSILEKLELFKDIDYIRDNRDIIDKLQSLIGLLTLVGILVVTATGISTLVVISHIIRQGIYNNREQINTLRLLGAPDSFIGFPFLLEGLFLTMAGGLMALGLVYLTIRMGYGQISSNLFIPLPDMKTLTSFMAIFILSTSGLLGIIGSFFGLNSARIEK
ncbi:MAG: permease-like cell division protein FtsX [Tissierellaceae bacterium]